MKKLFALGLIVSLCGAFACGGEKRDEVPVETEDSMDPIVEEPEMAPPVSEPMAEEPMGDQMGDDVQVPDDDPLSEQGE